MEVQKILNEVINEVKPSETDIQEAYSLYNEISAVIKETLRIREDFRVELEGSLAKGTALKDHLELDVFVLIRREDLSREWLKENFVRPLSQALKKKYEVTLRFASHPYLRIRKGSMEADIVPAYWAESIKEIKTPVDRTPFHTRYVINKLSEKQKDEVRLLKQFFKGLEVYGAEIRFEGFSGYLSEVLIIKYGDFLNTLRSMLEWKYGTVILVGDSKEDLKAIKTLFRGSPLIVPDPVDPRRNAAAAVSKKSLTTAIVGAIAFTECPSKMFFFPQKKLMSLKELKNLLKETDRVAAVITYEVTPSTPPDILWGELKRISKKIKNILINKGFTVVDTSLWSDESSLATIYIEFLLPEGRISKYEIREGPFTPVSQHIWKFFIKYTKKVRDNVIGPWVNDEGVIESLVRRDYIDPLNFLKSLPKDDIETKDLKLRRVGGLEAIMEFVKGKIPLENEILYWLTEAVVKTPSWVGACASRYESLT